MDFQSAKMAPTVKTVLGELSPNVLGKTFTHEHVSMYYGVCYYEPENLQNSKLPWTVENMGWIKQWA